MYLYIVLLLYYYYIIVLFYSYIVLTVLLPKVPGSEQSPYTLNNKF